MVALIDAVPIIGGRHPEAKWKPGNIDSRSIPLIDDIRRQVCGVCCYVVLAVGG